MVKKTKLKLALQGRLRAQDKVNDALKKEQLVRLPFVDSARVSGGQDFADVARSLVHSL